MSNPSLKIVIYDVMITGAAGQDGMILLNRLRKHSVRIMCTVKDNLQRKKIKDIFPEIDCVVIDLTNTISVNNLFKSVSPMQIYNFASQSSVARSWEDPMSAFKNNFIISMNILEGVKNYTPDAFLVTPISGDVYGNCLNGHPHTETTNFNPLSPYGISKISVYHLHKMYAESFGLKSSTPVLFNHESPLRPLNFLSKKISNGVAKIFMGSSELIHIENIEVKRDWGWAPDYVTALQYIMNSQDTNLYVISTGIAHSVKEFLDIAFNSVGISDWSSFVSFGSKPIRPNDISVSVGLPSLFKSISKWNPTLEFEEMVSTLVSWEVLNQKKGSQRAWRENF